MHSPTIKQSSISTNLVAANINCNNALALRRGSNSNTCGGISACGNGSNASLTRRKSLLGYHQQQQQQAQPADILSPALYTAHAYDDFGQTSTATPPSPLHNVPPNNGKLLSNNGTDVSGELQLYDDALTTLCCLPPPSPAPNSDRFVALASAAYAGPSNIITHSASNSSLVGSHSLAHKYTTVVATGSSTVGSGTSGRFHVGSGGGCVGGQLATVVPVGYVTTTTMTDRYRGDLLLPLPLATKTSSAAGNESSGTGKSGNPGPTTARFHISNGHFHSTDGVLANAASSNATTAVSTPIPPQATPPTSAYMTYLSASVHTPVKRYVPTPPPSCEYATNNASLINGGGGSCTPQLGHNNSLPYRYRLKCCSNDALMHKHLAHPQLTVQASPATDYYPTSPRMRGSGGGCKYASTATGTTVDGYQSTTSTMNSGGEYINIQQISTSSGISADSEGNSGSGGSTGVGNLNVSAATCLHCNTQRRTTGVHQTTQTTGPISPIPLPLCSGSSMTVNEQLPQYAAVSATTVAALTTLTPSTGESYISPLSPPLMINSSIISGGGILMQQRHQQTARRNDSYDKTSYQQQLGHVLCPSTHPPSINAATGKTTTALNGLKAPTQQTHQVISTSSSPLSMPATGADLQLDGLPRSYVVSQQPQQKQPQPRYSRKRRFNQYVRREIARFFGVDVSSEPEEYTVWQERQRRLAFRRFGVLNAESQLETAESRFQQGSEKRTDPNGGQPQALGHYNGPVLGHVNETAEQPPQQHYHQLQEHQDDAHNPVVQQHTATHRPDVLPSQDADANSAELDNDEEFNASGDRSGVCRTNVYHRRTQNVPVGIESDTLGRSPGIDYRHSEHIERKASVAHMFVASCVYIMHTLRQRTVRSMCYQRQWSRSFAPAYVNGNADNSSAGSGDATHDICWSAQSLHDNEVFFDAPTTGGPGTTMTSSMTIADGGGSVITEPPSGNNGSCHAVKVSPTGLHGSVNALRSSTSNISTGFATVPIKEHLEQRQLYISERMHGGWRTSALISNNSSSAFCGGESQQRTLQQNPGSGHQATYPASGAAHSGRGLSCSGPYTLNAGVRGTRISAHLLDGVLENSRRPFARSVQLFTADDLDSRTDHRPYFTYWINTVQILVLCLSVICYGIGPMGVGLEQRTGQVLVTSLSLQTVQHSEERNLWIGPRNNDLVHIGAKFATCMRRDVKIIDVLLRLRRQERETACCIRNDDSGCVQSLQADCSVRGLFPTKSISTWKKWSPGESGPGGRISGSVCGLDPKYCDAPASIAPYEWPDDITKWPICRKTNSFSQRFRYKDHTAEHMMCEVIGHPCCTGVYGECRITTREYCDFVNGYFHEEASLCSQISCLNNVCGMFPFISVEVPDQIYRLFTSLCLHAGILHLAITITFQHVFMADLERLIGPIRTGIVYIGCGLVGNLTSAILVPYKPEVGPLASLSGVIASLIVLLIFIHWRQLHKPHVALLKLVVISAFLFALGTLPWQLNFAGMLAGIFCGVLLTVSLVPFVSVSKYRRKSKINLIWSCIIFHVVIYTFMLIIFYVFPMELTSLNFGEVLSNTLNTNVITGSTSDDSGNSIGDTSSNIDVNMATISGSKVGAGGEQIGCGYSCYESSPNIADTTIATSNSASSVLDIITNIFKLHGDVRAQQSLFHRSLYADGGNNIYSSDTIAANKSFGSDDRHIQTNSKIEA